MDTYDAVIVLLSVILNKSCTAVRVGNFLPSETRLISANRISIGVLDTAGLTLEKLLA